MLYVVKVEVKIGRLLFRSVHDIEIQSSFQELTDTATIKLPRNLTLKGKKVSELIKPKDQVVIRIGYGTVAEVFTGYVREVEAGVPLVIRCEDEMYNLKRKDLKPMSWESVRLKELISYIVPGYQVQLVDPNMNLGTFRIGNATPARVLEELREQFRLYSYFRGKVLFVGFAYGFSGFRRHVYDFERNVRATGLKFSKAEDVKVRVKAIANLENGKKRVLFVGDKEGEVRTLNFGELTEAELKVQAVQEMKRLKYDGLRGDLTGWGLPATRHGDVAVLRRKLYPEQQGDYYIDAVKIRVTDNGIERANTLGPLA